MTASKQIDEIIAGLKDWRGPAFARVRRIIRAADPLITEEVKWRGAPVWSCDGNVCVGNAFKGKIKLTFPEGADLPDPYNLFNNGLDGKRWRAIDLFENDEIDERSLEALVRAAVQYNRDQAHTRASARPRDSRRKAAD